MTTTHTYTRTHTRPLLIAISGVSRAGKNKTSDFVAAWAKDAGMTHRQRGFADKLKWSLARIFFPKINMQDAIIWCDRLKADERMMIVIEHAMAPSTHEIEILMRDALRNFGTEAMRDIYGDDFWVDQLLPPRPDGRNPEGWHGSFLTEPKTPEDDPYSIADFCCITDLRFPNEVERVTELGGKVWKVQNEDAMNEMIEKARLAGKEIHRSDLEIPDEQCDLVLDNNDWRNERHKLARQVYAALDAIAAGRQEA